MSTLPPRLQHIEYAKSKSYATHRREDPDWVPPTSIHVQSGRPTANGAGAGEKRQRDDRTTDDVRELKRERTEKDSDDDEEMEIEDDDETAARPTASGNGA